MTTLQSLNLNVEVLNELINANLESRDPNIEILQKYVGFGGIKEINYDVNNDQHWNNSNKSIRIILTDLHEKLIKHYGQTVAEKTFDSIRSSSLSAFYTPDQIINPIVNYFGEVAKKETKSFDVLEPSSGTGAFIRPLLNSKHINSVVSIEKDVLTALIQKHIYQDDKALFHSVAFEKIINNDLYINKKFDLVISNIPFGDISIFDPLFNKLPSGTAEFNSQKTIHGYFFEKSISKLKDNGYIGFITSTSISDSINNDYLRKDILKKCELIKVIRLPNNVFDSTKVVSDLIILKKRSKTLSSLNELTKEEQSFLKTENIEILEEDFKYESPINCYFLDENKNPNANVIGTFSTGFFHNKPTITISSDYSLDKIGNEIHKQLTDVLDKIIIQNIEQPTIFNVKSKPLQLSLFDEIEPIIENNNKLNENEVNTKIELSLEIINDNKLVPGNVFVYKDLLGVVEYSEIGPILKPIVLKSSNLHKQLSLSAEILITYKKLHAEDLINPNSDSAVLLRKELNSKYDNYVKEYLQFSLKSNKIISNYEIEFFKLTGLEIYNEKSFYFEKSNLFDQSTYQNTEIKILTLEDAINKSLNQYKEINIGYVAELTNKSVNDIIHEGLEQKLFFINPSVNTKFDISQEYVTLLDSNQNSSYNFVTKDELVSGPIRFKILELEQNKNWFQNEQIFIDTLDLLNTNKLYIVPINELQPKLGENWIPKHHFENFGSHLFETTISINQNQSNSSYSVPKPDYSYKANKDFSVLCKSGHTLNANKLLEYALHGSAPRITYTVKEGESKKTYLDREAMSKAQMKIDTIHNEWNQFVLANPSIGKELENRYNNVQNINVERIYNGSHLELPNLQNFEAFKHQKNCVWQLLNKNGGLADHIVGAGKSLIIAVTAMELKRLEIANKPMIIGLKSNIIDIYKDFQKAYPDAKILFPSDKEFNPHSRKNFIQKIQNNTWDAVILTHEQFSAIPQSREIQEKILKAELHNIRLDLDEAIKNNEVKVSKRVFNSLQKRIENKEVMLMKLAESVKKDPNLVTFDKLGVDHLIVDEAHVFKNLEFSTRHTNVAGLGSPEGSARALNMLFAVRTLQEKTGGDKGVSFFTGTPISNTLAELYLLKKYLTPSELEIRNMPNFDSWARSYAELSRDFELSVTNEIKAKERYRSFQKVPELARWYRSFSNVANENNIILDRPKLVNNLIEIENTPLQKELSKQLIEAVKNDNFSYFGIHLDEKQLTAKMLIATNISTKISMDVRMINPNLTQDEGSKVNAAAKEISKEYLQSNHFKGTQLVFCDSSTPNADKNQFTIYNALKTTLVEQYNIAPEEIQFIHNFDSKTAKSKLFDEVNDGNVRILIGSTQKMGVGVNAQKKVVAMHHIDIPWSPKDLLQRNGRGERQGNIAAKLYNNNTVNNYIYATTGTLDAYKYFLVDLKQKFISQIKNSNVTSRTIDEGEMGDDGVLSASAFIARLSGKEELLEKNKIDKQINELELKRNVLIKDVTTLKNEISYSEDVLPKIENRKLQYEKDLQNKNISFNITEKGFDYILTTTESKKIKNKEDITNYLLENINKYYTKNLDTTKIGSIGKFDLFLNGYLDQSDKTPKVYCRMYIKSQETSLEYLYSTGLVFEDKPGQLYRQPFDSIKNIESKIEDQERSFKSNTELLIKNKEKLPNIDPEQFDKKIENLKHKSHELSIIIENDTENIEKNLEISQIINDYAKSKDYYQLDKYLSSIETEQNYSVFNSIINNSEFDLNKKEELLSNYIYDKNLSKIITSRVNSSDFNNFSNFSEINNNPLKNNEILIYQVLNSNVPEKDKLILFKMLEIQNPLESLSIEKENLKSTEKNKNSSKNNERNL